MIFLIIETILVAACLACVTVGMATHLRSVYAIFPWGMFVLLLVWMLVLCIREIKEEIRHRDW